VPVDDLIEITETDVIDDLMLRLVIAHTYVGDLSVRLTHLETGTFADVIDRPGLPLLGVYGCNESDIDATLSDAASLPVEDECAIPAPAITGTFVPNEALSNFDGEGMDGFWKLSVSDDASSDTGQLVSWCLEPSYVPEPGAGTMLLCGILLLLAERKFRRHRVS
jgi:extracellular elastinolytic metalloproteinase